MTIEYPSLEWIEEISESHRETCKLTSEEKAKIRMAVRAQIERCARVPLITKDEFDILSYKVIHVRVPGKKPAMLSRIRGKLVISLK